MQVAKELRRIEVPVDYNSDRELLKRFILFHTEGGESKYLTALRTMNDTIAIDLEDIALYSHDGLAQRIEQNAPSYAQLLAQVIDDILYGDSNSGEMTGDPRDTFFLHRIAKFKERFPNRAPTEVFPTFLLRNYAVLLRPLLATPVRAVRELGAAHIGTLVRVRGVVTRVSAVKPVMRVATYVCSSCGMETYQQVNTDTFDLLEECTSEKCRLRNVRGTLALLTRGSKFQRTQTLALQELTSDVPHGCIPRLLTVECFAGMTEQCRPGECVVLSGIFMPRPYYGMRRLRAGLLNDTFLHATGREEVARDAHTPAEAAATTSALGDAVTGAPSIDLLIRSFAPEICQMKDVKLVLLLMLAGAPALLRPDGMRIRGDINVLLMGDPGIAKSQLLKTVARLARRGVYTTGRGSSGVGLTAAVNKDPVTGEAVLEGGALVLSDGGVCCIDELDKMNETDRVAIHEVMEQQSVSIAKAGINTTLNARCAVLAAANPVHGRYDPKRSLEYNAGLPCSLLSRFDVVCVLNDRPDEAADLAMGAHVTGLHEAPGAVTEEGAEGERLTYDQLRAFLAQAAAVAPTLPLGLKDRLVSAYLQLRTERATPRALLALIRLAMAHARLRLAPVVADEDLDVAISVFEKMRVPGQDGDAVPERHAIYNGILGLLREESGRRFVVLEEVWSQLSYGRARIEEVVVAFENAGVWVRDEERGELVLVD